VTQTKIRKGNICFHLFNLPNKITIKYSPTINISIIINPSLPEDLPKSVSTEAILHKAGESQSSARSHPRANTGPHGKLGVYASEPQIHSKRSQN